MKPNELQLHTSKGINDKIALQIRSYILFIFFRKTTTLLQSSSIT